MPSHRAPAGSAVAGQTLDLDVGVIYTGERDFMPPLVKSVAGSGDGLAMRLILVDNASPDGAQQWTGLAPQVKVVANDRRYGYAANLNRILAASEARYALLLNTDMYFDVSEQCLAKMVAFMDDNPGCGLSVCRILHPDGSPGYSARRFPSWRVVAARRLGLRKLFGGALESYLYQERDPLDQFTCDWVSGCFMLVRREAIREIGRFDELYVKYFEDVDICLRLARAGWDAMYNGQTFCYHHEQRASRRLFSRDAWWHAWAYLRWQLKWGGAAARSIADRRQAQSAGGQSKKSDRRTDPAHASIHPGSQIANHATADATRPQP